MPRDLINIPLGNGVDTKTDPRAVDLDELSSATNVNFSTLRSLTKRAGNLTLPSAIVGGGTVYNGFQGLATLNNQLTTLGGDSNLYGVDIIGNAVRPIGSMQPMTVSTQTIQSLPTADLIMSTTASAVRTAPNQSLPTPQGIQVTAWEASTGGCYYQVADLYSGDLIVNPTSLVSPFYCSPRAITVGNVVILYFINGSNGNIVYYIIDPLFPTTFTTGNSGATVDASSGAPYVNAVYDVAYDSATGHIWIVSKPFGTSAPNVTLFNNSMTVLAAQQACPGITDSLMSPPSLCCNMIPGSGLYVFSVGSPGVGLQRVNWTVISNAVTSLANGTSGNTASVSSNGAGPITTALGTPVGGGSPGMQILVQTADSTTPLKVVQWKFNPSGSGSSITAAPVATQRGMHLVSNFAQQNAANIPMSLGIVAWESPQQATYFIVDQTLRIHGKFLAQTAGSAPDSVRNRLTDFNLNKATSSTFNAALAVQAQVSAVNGAIVTRNGVQLCTVNLLPQPATLGAQLGGDLHLTGGQLWDYDGRNLVEHGFHIFPELALSQNVDAPVFNVVQSQPAVGVAGNNVYSFTCPAASLITQNSYVMFFGTVYVVFGINGAAPTMPYTPSGTPIVIQCGLLSTDSASVVAQKMTQAIYNSGFLSQQVSVAANVVSMTLAVAGGGTSLNPQAKNSQEFSVFQTVPGTAGTKQQTLMLCPAGKYISGGQYFLLQGNTLLSGNVSTIAVWFQVASVGSAPLASTAGFNDGTIQVTLTGTETAVGVATAIKTALTAATGAQAIWSAINFNPGHDGVVVIDAINGGTAVGGYNFNVGGLLGRTSGTSTAGVYGYAVTYRWTDAAGQVHQSAPSTALNVSIGPQQTTALSVAGGSVSIVIPTLRISNKATVFIDVWRTVANGSIFYRLTSTTSPLANVTTADSITYFDSAGDSAILGSDILYTVGALPNIGPAGSCQSIVTFQNRLAIAGLDDANVVQFSQVFQLNNGVQWNPGLSFRLDPLGGPITALSLLDGNLLIFKKSQIWLVSGNGPDPLGNGAFAPPQFITGNVGCLGPSQVAVTQLGVVFMSEKGIYLIDRSLTVSYIGAPAKALLANQTVASVLSVEASNRVVFYTAGGFSVVWDYYIDPEDQDSWLGRWTPYATQSGIASCSWQGTAVFADSVAGVIYMQQSGSYQDGTTPFQFQFETAWIDETAKRQGFQRVWSLLIQGLFAVGQAVQVLIQYDDDTSYTDTVVWTPAILGDGNTYGGSPYGANIYGGQTTVAQPITQGRINIPRRRCSRVKFNISELTPSNQPIAFTTLTLEIATKDGGNRVGFANVAG